MPRETTSAELRRWVATWREAGRALAAVKREELGRLETHDALLHLADAFDAAIRSSVHTTTSGLVEQQAILQRLRR